MMHALLWSLVFTCAAACGVAIAQLLIDADGAARMLRLQAAVPIVLAACIGEIAAARGAPLVQLALAAVLTLALCGAWYADVESRTVPDVFTIVPLALVVVVAVVAHAWLVLGSAVLTFSVFAVAAWRTRGNGMGWGDAKLAGLLGAVLGVPWSVGVLGICCFAATVTSVARDRGKRSIAFAPYMSAATLLWIGATVHG